MKKAKHLIFILIIFGSLFFLFGPEALPENLKFQEILNTTSQNDVIIIFNSGGWGNTPLEKAEDFAPIIKGIETTLYEKGYKPIVIPYQRTKNSFLGKIEGTREFFNYFQGQSEDLASKVDDFLKNNPGKKVIMAGLSGGAAFVDETMKKISKEAQNYVYAIEVGTPFWQKTFNSENILRLDNFNKDPLSGGETKPLLFALFKAPFKWIFAKISGSGLSFSQAFQFFGHQYYWGSPEVGSQITSFLEVKLTSF